MITSAVVILLNQLNWQVVAEINAKDERISSFVTQGQRYEYSLSDVPADQHQGSRWVLFGSPLRLEFQGLRPGAQYRIKAKFLSDSDQRKLLASDGSGQLGEIALPKAVEVPWSCDLPKSSFASGKLVIEFTSITGPNAVLSELVLESTDPAKPKAPPSLEDKLKSIKTEVPTFVPVPIEVAGVKKNVLSLNGSWDFSFPNMKAKKVKVPGELRMQGIEIPADGEGSYAREFVVPQDWKGKTVRIRFDALFGDAAVYVNGTKVAEHDQTFVPLEVDITKAIRLGKNQIEVRIKDKSTADVLASASQYAAHPLFGILRKVKVYCLPEVYIEDIKVQANVDTARRNGGFSFEGRVNRPQEGASLVWNDIPGTAMGSYSDPVASNGQFQIKSRRDNYDAWTPEHPVLNRFEYCLQIGNKRLATYASEIGIRTIQVKGNRLLVNGVPVKLKGVCRHEADLNTGRSITPEQCDEDARLFKKMNCNYIRTSHYPPSEEFLDACDKYGIFVESEAPFCWVNHGANGIWGKWNSLSPELLPYLLYGNLGNVVFNRNHPSVLIWSLANESAWSPLWARVNSEVKKLDPSRPTSFHDQCWGGYNNNKSKADIAVFHYPDENGPAQCDKEDRPVLFGEYCHLECYNRLELETDPGIRDDWGRPFDRMVGLMQKHDECLGGAIWSGIDDTFRLPEGKLVGYGPWGPIDSLRREKPEAWHVKKAYSPVRVENPHALLPLKRTIELNVENRFDFTNLSELKVAASLGDELMRVTAEGAPHQVGKLKIELSRDPLPGDSLEVRFMRRAMGPLMDVDNNTIDEENLAFESKPESVVWLIDSRQIEQGETHEAFVVKTPEMLASVGWSNGELSVNDSRGKQLLRGGPRLMVLPLNSDSGGAGGNDYREGIEPFNSVCTEWKSEKPVVSTPKKNAVDFAVTGSYAEAAGSFTYRVKHDEIDVSYAFKLLKDVNPRQIGVVFYLPKSAFKELTWARRGYWTSYPDDHIGRLSGSALIDPAKVEGLKPWPLEGNSMGSNDFRSTKNDCLRMSLKSKTREVWFMGDKPQAMRAWIEGDRIAVLVTSFSTGGSDGFFATHYAADRKPLKAGEEIKGTVTIGLSDKKLP